MSFTGEYRHNIDAKGRLIIPSRLREALPDNNVVLSVWLDGCIAIWSESGWNDIDERLRQQGNSAPAARALARVINASASPDRIDSQGRITVPQHLRERAGIEREVVVIGAGSRGEIWSPDRWQEQQRQVEEGGLERFAEQLSI